MSRKLTMRLEEVHDGRVFAIEWQALLETHPDAIIREIVDAKLTQLSNALDEALIDVIPTHVIPTPNP